MTSPQSIFVIEQQHKPCASPDWHLYSGQTWLGAERAEQITYLNERDGQRGYTYRAVEYRRVSDAS